MAAAGAWTSPGAEMVRRRGCRNRTKPVVCLAPRNFRRFCGC